MPKNVLKPIDWVARVEAVGNKARDALAVKHPDRARAFEGSIKTARERVAARIRGVERQLAAIRWDRPAGRDSHPHSPPRPPRGASTRLP